MPVAKLGRATSILCLLWASFALSASAQPITLQCDPQQTLARFTLGDTLHAVHGAFKLKRCEIHFDPASGTLDGEIAFDATSGQSGNDSRDRKMHKEVLESARYPEIAFRPDRVAGNVKSNGASSVQVHGMFGIHGAEHDITVPVDVKLEARHWSASALFPVPYAKWRMKNPSVLFLRVGDLVDIEFQAAGGVKPTP
jgi:polyisoprenoid-binding protein YceI